MANESIGALLLKNTSLTEKPSGRVLALSGPNGDKVLDILATKGTSNAEIF